MCSCLLEISQKINILLNILTNILTTDPKSFVRDPRITMHSELNMLLVCYQLCILPKHIKAFPVRETRTINIKIKHGMFGQHRAQKQANKQEKTN